LYDFFKAPLRRGFFLADVGEKPPSRRGWPMTKSLRVGIVGQARADL
jgi:hypothetical protein